MASNRHLGRIIVLQSLYEYEFRTLAKDEGVNLDKIIAKDIAPYSKALGDTKFVYNLAHAVAERFEALDKDLQPMAPEWPLSTIAAVDRNVLRMGLYELRECRESVPPKVAINEAVELAKAFGSDNSSRFINGVLGNAYRQIYGDEGKTTTAPQTTKTEDATAAAQAAPQEEQNEEAKTTGGETA